MNHRRTIALRKNAENIISTKFILKSTEKPVLKYFLLSTMKLDALSSCINPIYKRSSAKQSQFEIICLTLQSSAKRFSLLNFSLKLSLACKSIQPLANQNRLGCTKNYFCPLEKSKSFAANVVFLMAKYNSETYGKEKK